MDLYNAKTREKESIDEPQALNEAIANRTHSFETGQEIPAINPYGEKVWIKSDDVHNKVALGYRISTPSEIAVENFVKENKGPLGAFGVFGAQAADEFLGGIPELIYNKTRNPLDVAKKEALKKEHNYANIIGGLTGGIGSAFYGPLAPLFGAAGKVGGKATQAITSRVAEKLGVQSAGAVGQTGLKRTAAEIVGRTAGMGIEGGIVGAPTVITELALGDPQTAAEHFAGSLGVGLAFGAGTGLLKEFYGLGKKVTKEIVGLSEKHEITKQSISRQLANVFTGVPEQDIKYYIDNFERLQKSPPIPREDLINQIDDAVSVFRSNVDTLKDAIKTNRTSQSLADEFGLSLQNIKTMEGQLSQQADDILGALPEGIEVADLISFVRKAKERHIPVEIGKTAKGAAKELDEIIADLKALERPALLTAEQRQYFGIFAPTMKAKIPFPMVRDIWQAVRKNVSSWNAANFNTVSDAAMKDISEGMRGLVKGKSLEFETLMTQMADLARIHQEMIKKGFGDRNKAAAIFDKITKNQSEIDRELISKFDTLTGSNYSQELNKYNDLKNQLAQAELDFYPLRVLQGSRVEAAIKNQGYKDPAHIYNVAFRELENKTEIPFQQMIRDSNVIKSFEKASTQGSRKAVTFGNVGTALGAAIGGIAQGPVGAAAGGIAGRAVGSLTGMITDIYGGKFLRGAINQNPSVAGLLFVEKALKKNADRIDRIPLLLEQLSNKPLSKVVSSASSIDALWRVLQTNEDELNPITNKSLAESTHKLSDIHERVTQLLSDPQHLQIHLEKLIDGLVQGGAPNIASDFVMKVQQMLQYIEITIPKPPKPSSPFQKPIKWRPSDAELFAFAQKLQVLEDPFSVLDALENGTLTQNHMEALISNFPEIFRQIQMKVVETAMSGATIEMDYAKRLKISTLLNLPFEDSLDVGTLNYLQSTFQTQEDQQNNNGGSSNINRQYAMSRQTQAQQFQNVRV